MVNLNHLLETATRRVVIPALPFRVDYDPDVDTLYLRFKEACRPLTARTIRKKV